jgi:peptidoglycan/xylan/chitin deacetylase (PgdA/CDA1 family)
MLAPVLAALARHDVRATLVIPGKTVETDPDLCSEIHASGHKIVF